MEYENIASKVMTSLERHCRDKGYELSALMGALNVVHIVGTDQRNRRRSQYTDLRLHREQEVRELRGSLQQ